MKKFFTLCLLICIVIVTRSQAVLNEVYPQPGNGYHEFFELYNEYNATENLDNYTVVTYYEDGTTSGFYVLDLPAASVAAHGYYVAASQTPFDIQSQLGQTANFSGTQCLPEVHLQNGKRMELLTHQLQCLQTSMILL